MVKRTFQTESAQATRSLARRLARRLRPGDVLGLTGPLGSGKTTFVQGLARGLGCRERPSSPTFVLAQTYHGRLRLHHLDFYRLNTREVLGMGLEDFYKDDGAVTVIEWIERSPRLAPVRRLEIVFEYRSPAARQVRFRPRGAAWAGRLRGFR